MDKIWNDPLTIPKDGRVVVAKLACGKETIIAINDKIGKETEIKGWRPYIHSEWTY